MTAEEQVREPAAFGEVFVSVIEEKEFPLNPHLLALSGNDMQHYCTMLSLQEFPNIKPEMFLQTEHGEMPLSLATVVEEFEAEPWLCEGNEPAPFDLLQQGCPGPQVKIQYDFVINSEGGLLQGSPSSCLTVSKPEEGTNLQTSENESLASGGNLTMSFKILEAHPTEEEDSSVVQERSSTGQRLCSCPNCGLSLNGNPISHQLPHAREKSHKCPSCGHLFSCNTTSLAATSPPEILHEDWERLFHLLDLNSDPDTKKAVLKKRFHCPDCGKGFVHKSSIPRHQKVHQKDNLSENPGQENRSCLAGNQLGSPKTGKKALPSPEGRLGPTAQSRERYAALCDVCGQSFTVASRLHRHLATHLQERPFSCCHCGKGFVCKSVLVRHLLIHEPEKPFLCRYCNKSYIQRSHLNRHCQKHHGMDE